MTKKKELDCCPDCGADLGEIGTEGTKNWRLWCKGGCGFALPTRTLDSQPEAVP